MSYVAAILLTLWLIKPADCNVTVETNNANIEMCNKTMEKGAEK